MAREPNGDVGRKRRVAHPQLIDGARRVAGGYKVWKMDKSLFYGSGSLRRRFRSLEGAEGTALDERVAEASGRRSRPLSASASDRSLHGGRSYEGHSHTRRSRYLERTPSDERVGARIRVEKAGGLKPSRPLSGTASMRSSASSLASSAPLHSLGDLPAAHCSDELA